jgi:segregation and condensation protein A
LTELNLQSVENEYRVKLPLYEGPLDLLLSLIRKNKVDIYDIPISSITGQYLQYLDIMKELNLDVAGEFLLMAATLIQIKSKMLLPLDEQPDPEEEDPRLELVERLIKYQSFKEAAYSLREREKEWEDVFFKEQTIADGQPEAPYQAPHEAPHEAPYQETAPCLFNVNLYDLLEALKKVMEKKPQESKYITWEVLTIKSKIAIILQQLEKGEEINFTEIFQYDVNKMDYIVTFLALLEMLKLGLIIARQNHHFGDIYIRKSNETNLH